MLLLLPLPELPELLVRCENGDFRYAAADADTERGVSVVRASRRGVEMGASRVEIIAERTRPRALADRMGLPTDGSVPGSCEVS